MIDLYCPWIAANRELFLLACMTTAALLEAILLWFAYRRPEPACPVRTDLELAVASVCAMREVAIAAIDASPMKLDNEISAIAEVVKAVNMYRKEKQHDLAS